MANQVFYSATMQKSQLSMAARYMVENDLHRVVYFVLRGGTPEQREELHYYLRAVEIDCIPLHTRPRMKPREMVFCRCYDNLSDATHLECYQTALTHIYGEKCRIRARIMWRTEA